MNKPEKSTWPSRRPIGGMITSSTSDETIFPKAAPIITPTAKSTTFPRMANSLNSFSTDVLLYCSMKIHDGPSGFPNMEGLSVSRIIVEAQNKETEQEPRVGLAHSSQVEGTLLAWPEDQIGSHQAAQHEQSAAGSHHRTDPGEGHARNREHQNAQKHERQPARPVLPAPPPLARTIEPPESPEN